MTPWSTNNTPEMYAEYAEGGKFYFPYVLVWVGSIFYLKHVGAN